MAQVVDAGIGTRDSNIVAQGEAGPILHAKFHAKDLAAFSKMSKIKISIPVPFGTQRKT